MYLCNLAVGYVRAGEALLDHITLQQVAIRLEVRWYSVSELWVHFYSSDASPVYTCSRPDHDERAGRQHYSDSSSGELHYMNRWNERASEYRTGDGIGMGRFRCGCSTTCHDRP